MKYLLAYLVIINAAGFLIMLIDKRKAQKNLWRIPERTIMSVAVSGGSVGVLLGMYAFRHKTKHLKFTIGVPVILSVQIMIAIFALIYMQK
jgi:uncharacterized membrane protein YsdA (DUF1294 family)